MFEAHNVDPLANNLCAVYNLDSLCASNQVAAPSPPPKEQPSRWWVWDVAGKLILLLVAGVAIALVWKNPGDWLGKMKTALV